MCAGRLNRWPLVDEPEAGFQGFLVLTGLLSRRVVGDRMHAAELLGPGDLVRPWEHGSDPFRVATARWRVHADAEIAVLDRAFHRRMARWPEVSAALLDRCSLRSRALMTQLLIAHAARIAERLHLLLWHLADRWGYVTPSGVVLPLRLSNALLAELACTTRESVSRALGALMAHGMVEPTETGLLLRSAATRDSEQMIA
jgi:CRP-like cAMP-binding protein